MYVFCVELSEIYEKKLLNVCALHRLTDGAHELVK